MQMTRVVGYTMPGYVADLHGSCIGLNVLMTRVVGYTMPGYVADLHGSCIGLNVLM